MGIEITLDNIGDGALQEKFADGLEQVVRNTCDPNTDATSKRKLTVEIVFTPDKNDRSRCTMDAKVVAKLAPTKPLVSFVTMGLDTDTGEIAAVEHVPAQGELFPKPEKRAAGKVVNLN